MTFDYDEVNKTLVVSTDDGRVMKYCFQDGQVGQLMNLILLQLENTSGGDPAEGVAEWAKVDNTDKIPEEKIPDVFDNVDVVAELPETGVQDKIYIVTGGDDAGKKFYWDGTQFVEMPSGGGITIGTVTGTAYDGGKGTELEGRVGTLETGMANYPTKEEMGTAINGVTGQIPDISDLTANVQTVGESVQIGQEDKGINLKTTGDVYSGAMVNSLGYIPTMTPYPGQDGRYVFQMRNHDSLSGVSTDGSTGGNLIMLSKWDVTDVGSKNFHTNLNVKADNGHNGRVTVNDDNEVAYLSDIPETLELNGLTELQTGAGEEEIKAALGVEFEELVNLIQKDKIVIIDRNSAGDYKTCIHATGNISSGNGGANLIFFVGTVPTIFEVQYVSGVYALYVAEYEFAKKSDLEGYVTTQNLSDSIAAEASAREKSIETATSDLVHNTLTVAGKSLTNNVTIASTDLTDGTTLAQKSEIPTDYVPDTRTVAGKALDSDITLASTDLTDGDTIARNTITVNEKPLTEDVVLYAADIKEKNGSADTVYDLMPKIVACPIDARVVKDSYTVAEIFNMFGGATTMTEVRVFADRGVNYLRMSNSIGSYQNYMIPVNYYQIPNGEVTTGTITLIGVGPNPDNKDLITKFTITMTLNGDASTITVNTKALEIES